MSKYFICKEKHNIINFLDCDKIINIMIQNYKTIDNKNY